MQERIIFKVFLNVVINIFELDMCPNLIIATASGGSMWDGAGSYFPAFLRPVFVFIFIFLIFLNEACALI